MKILMGLLLGILIMTGVMWSFSKTGDRQVTTTSGYQCEKSSCDAALFEEKIASVNKRLDDILIFGGIIITLLLGINAGVFINAERQVESYMRRNYQVYLDQLTADLKRADGMLSHIRNIFNLNISEKKEES
jgi:predicted transporter